MDDKKENIHQANFEPVDWSALSDNAHLITDLMKEKISEVAIGLQRKKDEVYRQAIEKHLGNFTEENAKKCTLIFDQGTERLSHDGKILCEIYPPEQSVFTGSTTNNQITYTQKYRIF